MPVLIPVSTPDNPPIEATDAGVTAHTPEGAVFARVVVAPGQTDTAPVMGPGKGITVTTALTTPHTVV